jgi:hypothetical protein
VRRVQVSKLEKYNADMSPVEFATVGKTKNGKIYHRLWTADEIDELLKEHGLGQPAEADAEAMET